MLILPRYIVREHIGPFVFSFFVITLFFLLNILFRELGRLLSRGLEFRVIVEYFALHMGWILALTIPMAVLPAVLMAFGRLSSDNEIVAIKASGVSLYRITAPVLVAAGALCVFCIWFGNSILPDMNHRARLLTGDIARKRPTLTLEPGVVFEVSPTLHLSARAIKESEGYSKLWGVVVDDYSEPDVTQTVFADSGE
ncbi:MAG: LptF/LptG family permease, partial [candidate division KSB1 bacterium]|nr:LptF/LptG family permease [candidate division KSB1 bacterium]